ncbi:hypothetical protein [Noviherbaspirillum sp. UKPF54]|uniref:hypothetical protein n=1 Tax=Noviherbaspirillum sp. UKPF54 TaxID=2601898 RepID=UPI0011B1AF54|nr:hypothetical protein [Noviherbaspirillum sp. UKPF54]QDZ30047.1 hypothetical protein FAY22_20015 [Noviherbaspirillum sp. UKPF54]
MSIRADSATLTLLILLALTVIGIVAYALSARLRGRRDQENLTAIRESILDYFRRSGVGVAVACVRLPGDAGFTAVVESEPMKRFRLSHIIEMTLREHVRKSCGLELDKIYWRFPVKQVADAVTAAQAGTQAAPAQATPAGEKKADEFSDEYINEGLEHYRHIPKPEVEELPWEQFEQVTTGVPKKSDL